MQKTSLATLAVALVLSTLPAAMAAPSAGTANKPGHALTWQKACSLSASLAKLLEFSHQVGVPFDKQLKTVTSRAKTTGQRRIYIHILIEAYSVQVGNDEQSKEKIAGTFHDRIYGECAQALGGNSHSAD